VRSGRANREKCSAGLRQQADDLARLGVSNVDSLLIGRGVKRPAGTW
jgi:hypothetical protein